MDARDHRRDGGVRQVHGAFRARSEMGQKHRQGRAMLLRLPRGHQAVPALAGAVHVLCVVLQERDRDARRDPRVAGMRRDPRLDVRGMRRGDGDNPEMAGVRQVPQFVLQGLHRADGRMDGRSRAPHAGGEGAVFAGLGLLPVLRRGRGVRGRGAFALL